MQLPIFQVDAFADAPFTGNPAAVCPLPHWLPDELLQAIAMENNLSETAFFVHEGDSIHLRWFTPASEVRLCGHATLATAHVLFENGMAEGNEVRFQSLSGELGVSREDDLLTLDFPAQPGKPCPVPAALVAALGAQPEELYLETDYMAVFSTEEEITALQPDFRALAAFEARGVIVTAPGIEVDFVSRFFAPRVGVDEDPVTGSAHCKLTPYWAKRLGRNRLTARQLSRRGGSLACELRGDRVRISGRAISYLSGTIEV